MTKARDIATGGGVDTTNFVTKSNGVIEALDGSALTSLTPANLDDTGTIPSQLLAGVGGGKVLQVQQVKINNNYTEVGSGDNTGIKTNSTNYVDVTGLSVSITPTSSTSKILAVYHANVSNTDSEGDTSYAKIKLLRDNNVTVSESPRLNAGYHLAHDMWSMSTLDEPTIPATPVAINYKIQVATGNANTHISCPHYQNECSIFLYEIAA